MAVEGIKIVVLNGARWKLLLLKKLLLSLKTVHSVNHTKDLLGFDSWLLCKSWFLELFWFVLKVWNRLQNTCCNLRLILLWLPLSTILHLSKILLLQTSNPYRLLLVRICNLLIKSFNFWSRRHKHSHALTLRQITFPTNRLCSRPVVVQTAEVALAYLAPFCRALLARDHWISIAIEILFRVVPLETQILFYCPAQCIMRPIPALPFRRELCRTPQLPPCSTVSLLTRRRVSGSSHLCLILILILAQLWLPTILASIDRSLSFNQPVNALSLDIMDFQKVRLVKFAAIFRSWNWLRFRNYDWLIIMFAEQASQFVTSCISVFFLVWAIPGKWDFFGKCTYLLSIAFS